jgi:tetratricopeptide (TPR) repeat protein
MTGKPWHSAFVAAAFALHPLHVESVAWVSERKDVLSTLFWLLTIYAYAWYAKHPNASRYILTLVAFAAGLMAKPMLVTLPFVLLLLDYWPIGRLNPAVSIEDTGQHSKLKRLIIEKIPFFVLAAAVCVIAVIAQQSTWAVATQENLPLKLRLLNVPISYVEYIEKMLWPNHLAVFYPHRGFDTSLWQSVASASLLVVLSILIFCLWRTRKYLPVGWLWYLGTLVPVIGIVQVGRQAMADRYTYIPLIGLFIIVAWGVCDLLAGIRYRKIILSFSSAAVLSALGAVSWQQAGYWRDDISLYKRATEVVPDNGWAYQLLGHALDQQGRLDEAINSYKESLRIVPDSMEVLNDIGYILLQQGKLDEAIALYRQMLPDMPDTGDDLATATPDAIKSTALKGVKLNATIRCYSQAHLNLGVALDRQGNLDEAIKHYVEALRVRPDYAIARKNLGDAFLQKGELDRVIEQFEKFLQIVPDSVEVHMKIAYVLLQKGRPDEAIMHIREVIHMQPNSAVAYYMLGDIYQKQGDAQNAIEAFNKAIKLAEAGGEKELVRQIQTQLSGFESR